jgi:hypothetical protein
VSTVQAVAVCEAMYEPKLAGYSDARWRLATHTCDLEAGHQLPHHCPRCQTAWNPEER